MEAIEVCRGRDKRRRLDLQKEWSRCYRDAKKHKFEQDVAYYKLLNAMHNIYPPQQWTSNQFKDFDEPLTGERKDKNRISSANSRRRLKLMEAELQNRIELLSTWTQPIYNPPLHFPLPPEELELPPLFKLTQPPVVHSEIKIRGETATSGIWIL